MTPARRSRYTGGVLHLRVSFLVVVLAACSSGHTTPTEKGVDAGDHPIDSGPRTDGAVAAARMYAQTADTLYILDDKTFALTMVGMFDNGGDSITDIAVTPDGGLYGISNTKLYSIDRDTAKATLVGPVSGTSNVGLTFLDDGTLLAADKAGKVRQIDPTSGAVTERGDYGSGYRTAGDLVAVADGTMYAIAEPMNGSATTPNRLLTINPANGKELTDVGGIGYGKVFGCAYANGKVYAFTRDGDIIEIDRNTAVGTLVKSYPGTEFYGAGVSPNAPVD